MSRIKVVRKGISRWKRIVQAHNGRRDCQPEWRDGGRVLVQIHPDEIVCNSTTHADGCLAVSRRIPRNSDAWFQVFPLALYSRFRVEAWIASITEACRSTSNDLTLNTFVNKIVAESGYIPSYV